MWFLFGEAGDFAKAVSNYLGVGEFSLKLGRRTVTRDNCHKQTGMSKSWCVAFWWKADICSR